jgi:FAD/FMN-containing dehydrogenase
MPGGNLGPWATVALQESFASVGPWIQTPEGPVLRAGAGATAAAVDREAQRRGRFLPPLPSSARWCTVGGMAANNAAGARSFGFGATAPWVHALEGLDARGRPFRVETSTALGAPLAEAARSLAERLRAGLPLDAAGAPAGWPGVRKNSSGYALDRFLPAGDPVQLLVGSEGTLALLTHVEWRTAPLPEARGLQLVPARSPDDLVRLALGAQQAGAVTCEFLGRRFLQVARLADDELAGPLARDAYALLLLEVSGTTEEVQDRLAACADLGRGVAGAGLQASEPEGIHRLWSLRHSASPIIAREAGRGRISTQFIEDSVVPVRHLGTFLEALEGILDDAGLESVVFGHAGDGNVHVNPLLDVADPDWRSRVREVLDRTVALVGRLGGTLAGEHGDGRLRAPLLHRIWGRQLVEAFRQVKATLDPHGVLNPGVILPLPGQDPLEGLAPRPRSHPPA